MNSDYFAGRTGGPGQGGGDGGAEKEPADRRHGSGQRQRGATSPRRRERATGSWGLTCGGGGGEIW